MRIALIGAGHRGIHLVKLMTSDPHRATLVAVAEPRKDRQENCRKVFSLPSSACFNDHKDLLAHRDKLGLDAAVIATNVATHAEIACACLEAGIPIFLEKPMAKTIEDGWKIVELAERTKVLVQVGFNMRYSPFFIKLHELATSGEVGTIISVEWTEVIGARHWADGYCRNPSYGVRDAVGTGLLEKSCHYMDMLRWIIGVPCERVASFGSRMYFLPRKEVPEKCSEKCPRYPYCIWKADLSGKGMASWLRPEEREVCVFHTSSDIVDHQNAILEFRGGSIVSFNLNPFGITDRRYFMIYGTDGMIYGDTSTNKIHLRKVGSEEVIYDIERGVSGHGGADMRIANAFINFLNNPDDPMNRPKTGVLEGFEAVLMACAIEVARREKRVVELEELRKAYNFK